MITPDQINATFEVVGALLTFMNTRQVWKDRGHAGIFVPAIALFTTWGFWNLYYYATLRQWWSVSATVVMVLANLSWLSLMFYYGKKKHS